MSAWRTIKKMIADPIFWQVFQQHLPLSDHRHAAQPRDFAFVIAYHLDRVRIMHGFIRALYFLPFLTTADGHGLGLALVLPARADRGDQRVCSPRSALPQQPFLRSDDAGAVLRADHRRSGPGSGSRSSSSSPVCAPSRARFTKPRALTVSRGLGPSSGRSPCRSSSRPSVFLVVFSSIGFLRIFDQVYNMTTGDPGGPLNATKPLVLMIYQTAFSSYHMGYAAAQTVVLFTRPAQRLPAPALCLLREPLMTMALDQRAGGQSPRYPPRGASSPGPCC
jgi:multiple sugar transport system permease protein